MNGVMRWTLFAALAAASACDLKWKEIPIWLLGGGTILLAAEGIWGKNLVSLSTLTGVLIGIALIALAGLFRNHIGSADGVIFLWAGLALGGWDTLWLLTVTLFLICLCGSVWMFLKKRRRAELPMVPFVLLVYTGGWMIGR